MQIIQEATDINPLFRTRSAEEIKAKEKARF
jgi:hypothetical protein